jgi:enoyl-[acyl-carrier-protein] reductase (NADH)
MTAAATSAATDASTVTTAPAEEQRGARKSTALPGTSIAVATAFLATDYAKLITGETVHVDSGRHILG